MEIIHGGIYRFDVGDTKAWAYRLVIGDVYHDEDNNELFIYSIMGPDEKGLLTSTDIALEHPRENWHFERLATPEEFKQALGNFRLALKTREGTFYSEHDKKTFEYDYESEFGKSSSHK